MDGLDVLDGEGDGILGLLHRSDHFHVVPYTSWIGCRQGRKGPLTRRDRSGAVMNGEVLAGSLCLDGEDSPDDAHDRSDSMEEGGIVPLRSIDKSNGHAQQARF